MTLSLRSKCPFEILMHAKLFTQETRKQEEKKHTKKPFSVIIFRDLISAEKNYKKTDMIKRKLLNAFSENDRTEVI